MASWSSERGRCCRQFTLAEIKKATESFNNKNIVGKGGEGIVYKGVFADARRSTIHIAVKRLNRSSPGERALKSYEKEIKLLSKFHHANLVSLIGYCQESEEKILVYELMSNENLRDKLRNTTCPLSYEQRLIICIGAARAIDYLHSGTSLDSKIIHGDVKPDNILLTEKMEAKVSDFGLSRIVAANQTRSSVITLHLCGTPGYFAPEYYNTGKFTWRIDVYAFGVVLTEVLCKKKPPRDDSNFNHKDYGSFRKWAVRNIDPVLKREISESSLEAFINTAEKCLNEDPYQRPRMNEVVGMLDSALKLQKKGEGGSCIKSAANGEKRQVDSESSISSSSWKSSYGFRTSKSAKFEYISSDLFSESSKSTGMSGSTWQESDVKSSGELTSSSQNSQVYKSWGKSEAGPEDARYSIPSTEIDKEAGEEMMSKKDDYERVRFLGNIDFPNLKQIGKFDLFSESSTSTGMSGSTWQESDVESSGALTGSSQDSRVYKSWGKSEAGPEDARYSIPSTEIGKEAGEETMSKKDDSSSNSSPSVILADIPGTQGKVVLYYGESTSEAKTGYMKVRLYLNIFEVDIEERDPTKNKEFEIELSQFLSRKHKEMSFPQLFIGGKYIGGAKEVIELYDSGELGQYLSVYQQ